jgi:hypothetical protein
MTLGGLANRLAELVNRAELHGGTDTWLAAHRAARELEANLHGRIRHQLVLNDNPAARAKLTEARANLRGRGVPGRRV